MILLFYLWLQAHPAWGFDFFVDYIQNHLDHNVRPCDDFFNHVCPAKSEKHFYMERQKELLKAKLKPYQSTEYKNFVLRFKNARKNVKMSRDEYRSRNVNACSTSPDVVKNIQHFFDIDSTDCKTDIAQIEAKVLNKSDEESEDYGRTVSVYLDRIYDAASFNRFINDPASNYTEVNLRYQTLFSHVKSVLSSLLMETPWVIERRMEKQVAAMIRYIEMSPFACNSVHERAFDNIVELYDDCVNSIFLLGQPHQLEMVICLARAIDKTYNFTNGLWKGVEMEQMQLVEQGTLTLNAMVFDGKNIMLFLPAFLNDDIVTNPYSMVASLGFIVAHEVSHALFDPITVDTIMLPQRLLQKLADFVAEECRQTNESACRAGNSTRSEDAPDWMAMRLAKYTADHLQEPVPEELDIIRDQLVFYSAAITFCDRTDPFSSNDPVHSPPVIRIRAMVMNHPDFATAFKCTPKDRMYVPREKQVDLLGTDKP